MKKSILLAIILLFTFSCAGVYQQASHTADKVYLGMTVKDFKTTAGSTAKMAAMEEGYTVYKMYDYDVMTGAIVDTKFFYFDSIGKLYKIDGGEFKQNRYQVEVINK